MKGIVRTNNVVHHSTALVTRSYAPPTCNCAHSKTPSPLNNHVVRLKIQVVLNYIRFKYDSSWSGDLWTKQASYVPSFSTHPTKMLKHKEKNYNKLSFNIKNSGRCNNSHWFLEILKSCWVRVGRCSYNGNRGCFLIRP